MDTANSPTLLLLGAILLGTGLYLIQRGRFLVPLLMRRIAFLGARPRLARYLLMFLLTVGILSGGMGCRIILNWLRG
jgi:hypothetical protein